ncbi:YncE family protein [Mycolicibacterium fortuitum]|uniref:YncE family protein n=1 Tax=Mycolicibacterium fortuitum TaxID=1766 RepID=UPI003AAB8F4F
MVRVFEILIAACVAIGMSGCGQKDSVASVATNVGETFSVGGTVTSMAIDPSTGHLYVNDYDGRKVLVLDPTSHSVVRTLDTAEHPTDIAISSSANVAFVSEQEDGTVSAFDLSTGTKKTTFSVGKFPNKLALNDSAQLLYVQNQGSATISIVELPLVGTSPDPVFETLSVQSNPVAMVFVPSTQKIFVGSQVDGSVQIIDMSTNTVGAPNKVGVQAGTFADGGQNEVYYADWANGIFSSLDSANGQLLWNVPVGANPSSIAVNGKAGVAYVALNQSNAIAVVDLAKHTVDHKIDTGPNPQRLLTDPKSQEVYLAQLSGTIGVLR